MTATPLREVRLPEATRDLVMDWLSSPFGCERVSINDRS
jgi:hypothetical protein